MKVVIITGSRDWTDPEPIERVIAGADLVVHGGARGADAIAHQAALRLQSNVLTMPARWREFGKRAGFERNQRMAVSARAWIAGGYSVHCHAFPLPGSRGTWDCVERMRALDIPTTVHGDDHGVS